MLEQSNLKVLREEFLLLYGVSCSAVALEMVQKQIASLQGYSVYPGEGQTFASNEILRAAVEVYSTTRYHSSHPSARTPGAVGCSGIDCRFTNLLPQLNLLLLFYTIIQNMEWYIALFNGEKYNYY